MKSRCIIMDIDGVLCDSSKGVKEHIIKNKDYEGFRKDYAKYPMFKAFLHLCNSMNLMFDIVIITGRKEKGREATKQWLKNNSIDYHKLIMRSDDDNRPGEEVKKDFLQDVKEDYDILFAIDDKPEINRMYKVEGILCLMPNNTGYDVEYLR